jgi:ferredoxin
MMESKDSGRLPNNVQGRYHTTEECDGCAYCALVAPENFDFDKESNSYFVSKQPTSAEEEELIQQAIEDCPIGAIVDTGNAPTVSSMGPGQNEKTSTTV